MPRRDRAQIELWFRLLWRVLQQREWAAEHIELRKLESLEAEVGILVVQPVFPLLAVGSFVEQIHQQFLDRLGVFVARACCSPTSFLSSFFERHSIFLLK